ncbi:sulfur carrier protein ThiS [Thalassococcus sp. S3]|uniref:sulfur carrier protein ThiS n=1 Tax=Thalassococcus sp. S3 TaxID=2017482 RepID=UPI0010242FBB|nr:sulfur carrier protein ThiS [Thalassococcus sp. S3]QBF33045.1 thiamine biosynthesis protein ThiS [Thalassococcus sp. S3]
MKIIVNAEPLEVSAQTLSEAIDELGFDSPAIATAINGVFVPRSVRDTKRLTEGDRLEILAPMQGG